MESQWLELNEVDVEIPDKKLAAPIRILHMSDFHASAVVTFEHIEQAIRLGLSAGPDLICLTGDFYTATDFDRSVYVSILRLLSDAAPTFACFGNHDGGPWIARRRNGFPDLDPAKSLMDDSGIVHLDNRSRPVTIKGQPLHIVGLGDWLAGVQEQDTYFDPQLAFREAPAEAEHPVLLLSHNPDSKKTLLPFPWDLMLCGHTHGGQFALPLIGTPFAPVTDKRLIRGLHDWEGRQIHITKGVGNVLGVRFNCRPEVSVLTLSGKNREQ
jgi:predicted MPP superfamily phosphohydrolase